MNKACKLKGSTLIEVLVTMVIIAIGLLGQANLIAVSLKVNHSAFARTQATLLAYDIIERLRLNRALAMAASFNSNYADDSASYTGNAIQDLELHDWKAGVEQALPSGQAQVSVDGNGNVTINIRWNDEVAKKTLDPENEDEDGVVEFATQSVI